MTCEFKLLTKPTQFVSGKTEDTLCDIIKRVEELNLINDNEINNNNEISEHLIDVIVTNNNLLETEMWKCRTINKFKEIKDIKIHIISSKSKDFKDIEHYINNIIQTKEKCNLPNVLIVCYHTKRVCDDIIKLCYTFGGLHKMILPNISQKTIIKFHISLDEPDANIGVTKKFILNIKSFIENDTVIGVLFITATPIPDFWKMLNTHGIVQLLNMNKDSVHNFDEDLQNYRSFKDHNVIEHNNATINPLTYIKDLFLKNKIDETTPKRIFAPGHRYTEKMDVGSHDEIEKFFIKKNYTVLKINGKWKGFTHQDTTKDISLQDYNKKYNINGELRDTLRHWNENNPKTNLAITGYWVLERGVTFNTINFNFTEMIISNYHLNVLAKLIQLLGRGCGGKLYVDIMNIYCTTDIKNTIEHFNAKLYEICSLNPTLFNRMDFTLDNNTIPVKLEIIDTKLLEMLIKIRDKHSKNYKLEFHTLLKDGINNNKIKIYDNNNVNKFDIAQHKLYSVRMYKIGDKIEVRRFKQFNDGFNNFKSVTQSSEQNEYNVDFAKDKYINNDYVNETNIFWITFKI